MSPRLALAGLLLVGVWTIWPAEPAAQATDLDQLMERVLARRDENWTKLQQYILDEREVLDVTGPGGARLYGLRRDYTWYQRDGMFVRSPLRVDGVTLKDDQRRKAENDWMRDEQRRAKREASKRGPEDASTPAAALEPAFVSYAYFLRFKFEPGHYALVGRETLEGQPVLRIEYFPTRLFTEGRTRPNRRARDRDAEVEDKMNKVSLITLWVDPARHQILQYTFDDIDMNFLPGRTLARVADVKATMRMGQPFPEVWLPRDIEMRFAMTLAAGRVDAHYRVEYHDYRQADVTYKVR
jgi:hypothetical protein